MLVSVFTSMSPYIASTSRWFTNKYCQCAMPMYDETKVRTLNLPFLSDIPFEDMGFPDDIITEITQVNLRKVDREIYYYFTKFSSIQSDMFHETLTLWGYTPMSTYFMLDVDGNEIALETAASELYCRFI